MSEFPPAASLPELCLRDGARPDEKAVSEIVEGWIATLQQRLDQKDGADISDLFVVEAWWRDVIALSWDFHSKSGPAAISSYVRGSSAGFGQLKVVREGGLAPKLEEAYGMHWIQAGFTFKTRFGSGKGIVRLANSAPSEWKAWTVMTQLEQLTSQDGPTQPQHPTVANGQPRANGATNGDGHETLPVLIVGGGTQTKTGLRSLRH